MPFVCGEAFLHRMSLLYRMGFGFSRKKSCELYLFAAVACRKSMFFQKKCLSLIPNPKPLPRGEGLCMLSWLCIVQSLWAYTPGIRAGAECGAAALTKQGCLQSVAHSRCTTQRHQRLTTRIGATPKARTLWLLAKSFARCKTNIASNAKHPFSKII